jgi:hypothetical protein
MKCEKQHNAGKAVFVLPSLFASGLKFVAELQKSEALRSRSFA